MFIYIHIYIYIHTLALHMCLYAYMCIHTNTMKHYSATKQKEIMPFEATWMDLEIIILSEISQKEKDKDHCLDIIYMWSLEK